jgi:hypothetical protein
VTFTNFFGEIDMADRTLPKGKIDDFNFLFGTWDVHNRRLVERWVGSDVWEEFSGESHCEPRLGTGANVDELSMPDKGFSGLTLRVFDIARQQWAIYWVSSQSGVPFPPVHGGFTGDHGVFFGKDEDEGQPVHVRFFWSKLGPDAARWQQAFSRDGLIWETNWIMDFTRKS